MLTPPATARALGTLARWKRRRPSKGRAFAATVAIILASVVSLLSLGTSRAEDQSWVRIDSFQVNGTPIELSTGYPVPYVSDCDPGDSPPRCGPPAAQWSMAKRPVQFCTFVQNRPSWLSESQFRDYVRQSAATWNHVEAAIGVAYTGDCRGTRWERRDGENQISFDDERNVLSGATLGLTESSIAWAPPTNPTIRRIDEADIILETAFPNVPTCLLSTITHEMGHALGFGHSTNPADLMYASVDLSRPDTCHTEPTESEQERLQNLYGVDRRPTATLPAELAAPIGFPVSLPVAANDPEGQQLTFLWEQVSGQPVELNSFGALATFQAPSTAGIMQFKVTAYDPYLHPGPAMVNVTAYVSAGKLTYGEVPREGGFALVVFGGGLSLDLVYASGCPPATASFWTTDNAGRFVIYLPASTVTVVNAAWEAKWGVEGIPEGTPLLGRCR